MIRPEFAVFPLWGIVPGDPPTCACERVLGKPCTAKPGKHPAYPYSTLGKGQQVTGRDPSAGHGVATGERSGCFVLDFDNLDSLASMIHEHGEFPPTYSVGTPRGAHMYFAWPGFRIKSSASDLAPGIDVRGDGGYAVGAGSPHKCGGRYEVLDDLPIAPAPAWLLGWPGLHAKERTEPSADAPEAVSGPERDRRLALYSAWLANEPPCISKQSGQKQIWHVIHRGIIHEALSRADVRSVFDVYNERCEPAWPDADIEHTIDSAISRAVVGASVFDPDVYDTRGAWEGFCSRLAAANDTSPRSSLVARLAERQETGDPSEDRRRTIIITSELHHNVADACVALGDAENLYQRGGRLVRVVYQAVKESDRKAGAGAPTIQELRPQTLKAVLTSVAQWIRRKKEKGEWKEVSALPADDIVADVLHRGQWPEVRVLSAISETPLFRPDGSIVQVPGYDPETSYIYKPSEPFPEIPESPTREDATAALAELRDVFVDFPYVDDAAAYVPVAAVLSIMARPAIGAVPLFVFDAAVRGSGKSLQTDAISLIATGRLVAKANWTHEDEIKKALETFASEGAALFSWDNVPAGVPFGNSHLDAALTNEGAMKFRILGRTESKTAAWSAVQLATGNNFSFRGDTGRRSIISRLEPTVENPEAREGWTHPNLRTWIKAERTRLAVAALTLLRAYFAAGCPDPVKPIGSFESWTRLVPSAIRWAGGADVTLARDVDADEPEKDMLRELHAAWPEGGKFTAKELFAKSTGLVTFETSTEERQFREALREVLGDSETPTSAAGKLRAHAGRIIAGRKLDHKKDKDRKGMALWQVIRA
jgi:putative DNA primase/helicase